MIGDWDKSMSMFVHSIFFLPIDKFTFEKGNSIMLSFHITYLFEGEGEGEYALKRIRPSVVIQDFLRDYEQS